MGDILKSENSSSVFLGRYFAIFRLTFNMRSQKLNELNLTTLLVNTMFFNIANGVT
jgi:hypothetical protein